MLTRSATSALLESIVKPIEDLENNDNVFTDRQSLAVLIATRVQTCILNPGYVKSAPLHDFKRWYAKTLKTAYAQQPKQGPKKAVNNTESNRISERVPSPAHLLLTDDQKASSIRRLLCKTRMRDRGLTHVWSRKLKRKSIPIFEHERAASPVIVLTTEERAAKGRRMRRKTVMRLRGISRVWVKDGRFRSDMALMSSPSGDLTCKEGVARQRRHRRKNILIKRGLSKVWTCARSKRPNIAKKETGNAHETAVHETEALMSGTPTSAN